MNQSPSNVFIAGGTSGINLAIAESFAMAGANVGVMSRDPGKVEAAVSRIGALNGNRAAGWSADVRDFERVKASLGEFHSRFGAIDALISGAAGNFLAPALGMSPNAFRTVIDIDLIGTFHVLTAAHEFLRKPGASIINISASQAYIPMLLQSHVCAAKAGIDMLTRSLAMEWAPEGIRINSIAPGPVSETEGMVRLAPTPQAERELVAKVPMGRWSRKEEIASVAQFLASSASSMVTGQVIPVDGGLNLGRYTPELAAQVNEMVRARKVKAA